jgi:hypothetical protein
MLDTTMIISFSFLHIDDADPDHELDHHDLIKQLIGVNLSVAHSVALNYFMGCEFNSGEQVSLDQLDPIYDIFKSTREEFAFYFDIDDNRYLVEKNDTVYQTRDENGLLVTHTRKPDAMTLLEFVNSVESSN